LKKLSAEQWAFSGHRTEDLLEHINHILSDRQVADWATAPATHAHLLAIHVTVTVLDGRGCA
jgi:hypothetical protein